MSTTLRPPRSDEWESFLAMAKRGYLESMVAHGRVPRDLAEAKAERDFATLLPDGFETPDHFVFAIEDDGERAGWLWLAERTAETGHSMFVYAIEVDADRRGRGIGRAAMLLAEEEARRRGVPRIGLNVFGGNDVARGLYRSLGYAETAVFMEKSL